MREIETMRRGEPEIRAAGLDRHSMRVDSTQLLEGGWK